MMAGGFREVFPEKGGIQTGSRGKEQSSQWLGPHTGKGPETENRAWLEYGKLGPPEETGSSCEEEILQSLVEGLEPGPAGRGIICSCQQD